MFDQYLSLIEHDNRKFQVYQEQYVHNLLYDIPNWNIEMIITR